jgi:hypothetical protein
MEGKHLFLERTELTGHCPRFADFERKVASYCREQTRTNTDAKVEWMTEKKMTFTAEERADKKIKYLDYPEWVEYKVGNKQGKMTVLVPDQVPEA